MRLDGNGLKKLLIDLDVSQTELAQRTGFSRATINTVCNGKRCTDDTAHKIADALGVKVEELTTN